MSKSFGGKQRSQRDTEIKQEQGYLGTYPRQLNIGDVQKMNFGPNDPGPFWMTPEEQQNTRNDITDNTIQKRRVFTKKELQQRLTKRNINVKGTLAAQSSGCLQK